MVFFSIGLGEIGLVSLAIMASLLLCNRWLIGVANCFLLGTVVTPADIASMLVVGGVFAAVYCAATVVAVPAIAVWRRRHRAANAGRPN